MTIEERTRQQEKSQFTEEEYRSLHNQHGINSPFGIGYYLGSIEERKNVLEIVEDVLSTRPYLDNVLYGIMNEIKERLDL